MASIIENGKSYEICDYCDQLTGKAGRLDDSLVCESCDCVICEDCQDKDYENEVLCKNCGHSKFAGVTL